MGSNHREHIQDAWIQPRRKTQALGRKTSRQCSDSQQQFWSSGVVCYSNKAVRRGVLVKAQNYATSTHTNTEQHVEDAPLGAADGLDRFLVPHPNRSVL